MQIRLVLVLFLTGQRSRQEGSVNSLDPDAIALVDSRSRKLDILCLRLPVPIGPSV